MSEFLSPPPHLEPIAIYNDGGGLVSAYAKAAERYWIENRQVEILGSCRSACVLALSVPNVCVGPNAVVKAHAAYDQVTKEINWPVTHAMMDVLPVNIAAKLTPNIRQNYWSGSTLTADQLAALGVRRCSEKALYAEKLKQGNIKVVNYTVSQDPVTSFLTAAVKKLGVK